MRLRSCRCLPKSVWGNTALGQAQEHLHSSRAGGGNTSLLVEEPFANDLVRNVDAACLPMISLEPQSLARWSRFVVSPTRTEVEGVDLLASKTQEVRAAGQTTEARLRAFRKMAPGAFQLLRLLAGVPLTLPIMRLVRSSLAARRRTSFTWRR